jgi:hypothetical protein
MLLTHGDVHGSMLVNPLGVVLCPVLILLPLWLLADVMGGRDSLLRRYQSVEKLLVRHSWISVLAIMLVLLNWVWNIAKGL